MTKIIISTMVFLVSIHFSIHLFADTNAGSVSTATGGSGRAAAEPIDGVLLNPAIVSILPSKFFSANYTTDKWGVTISDNGEEALFPAALAFSQTDRNNLKTQQIGLALSYTYKKIISVGTNISMFEYDQGNQIYSEKYRQTTGDLGLVYSPLSSIGIALVANKVYSTSIDLKPTLQKQQTFALGLQYTYLNFARFRLDAESAPENKTDRLVYMGGLETYLNDWIIIRLGYQNNNVVSKNYSSFGLGFAGPQFGLHYAYISNVADKTDDKHSIDLGIPF